MASGDELLKFIGIHALTDTANETTVAGGHTYTIISVTFCEMGSAAESISMYVDDASGNDIFILNGQSLPSKSTFVYNEKIVLEAADKLGVVSTAGNVDVTISYLDQEL